MAFPLPPLDRRVGWRWMALCVLGLLGGARATTPPPASAQASPAAHRVRMEPSPGPSEASPPAPAPTPFARDRLPEDRQEGAPGLAEPSPEFAPSPPERDSQVDVHLGEGPEVAGAPLPPIPPARPPTAPPFEVLVGETPAAVRGAGPGAHTAGALAPGARAWVVHCIPDCTGPGSWLELQGGGRVLRRSVEPLDPGSTQAPRPLDERPVQWARVTSSQVKVFARPDPLSEVIATPEKGATLALVPDAELKRSGWRARRAGGYVPAHLVRPYVPVDFAGEEDPSGPLAFVLEDSVLVHQGEDGELAQVSVVPAFGHVPVLDPQPPVEPPDGREQIRVDGGLLPRETVRLARAHSRPTDIPEDARWVHIDRAESVLTAYEGDRWVYAALVSVGTPDSWRSSDPGLFQVFAKHRYAPMALEGEYDVESVPFVLFYNRGEALHGAFWHDDFGHPVSFGCINLSLTDARWLFGWAPPELPEGWTSRNPTADEESLWVWVE